MGIFISVAGVASQKYLDRIDKEQCLIVPEKLKNEILQHCHDDKVAGHLGKDKTI
jgi:hypothetical protein